jgi:glycosyltransferase involved in cell wall biosynthesis
MSDFGRINLVLFFTRGISLRTWDEMGIFEREVALYRHLNERGVQVSFITYGDGSDLSYADHLPGIRILCNRWRLPERWYIRLVSWLHPLLWPGPAVFKSNQVLGADIALRAARRCGKKFIARSGYLPSNIDAWYHGAESAEAQKARQLEAAVFPAADRVVVTTSAVCQTVVERYGVKPEKVRIIPNYVDTKLFKPPSNSRQPNLLCFVGRLSEEKNIPALLDAIHGLDVELAVIGGGSLEEMLRAKTRQERLAVRFLGNISNAELPAHLNRASLFILPSFIEHHPKALLEAMACGLAVIGTGVPGIRDLIRHRETGYLCGTSSEEIRAAIQDVLADADLRARMGRNAREFVVEHFALERVLEMELALLEELAAE